MVATTPADVRLTFARHGAPVVQVAQAPEICRPAACTGVMVWSKGGAQPVWLAPQSGRDFLVALTASPADARGLARFQRAQGLGAATKGRVLLLFARSSARVARLKAALAALR